MKHSIGVFALGLVGFVAAPAFALDFGFSFSSEPGFGNVSGTVTGELMGLQDMTDNQLPAKIVLDSFPAALGITKTPPVTIWIPGEPAHFFDVDDSFVNVTDGQIT